LTPHGVYIGMRMRSPTSRDTEAYSLKVWSSGCSIAFVTLAVVPLLVAGRSQAQPSPQRPAFDVASIKLDNNCGARRGRGGGFSPVGYSTSCVPLRVLIRIAYGRPKYGLANPRQTEVLGGPEWLDSEVYDIAGKGTKVASLGRVFDMLQTLLEERCKLKIHTETREVPIYALTVAKGGIKMQATKAGTCRPYDTANLLSEERVSGEPDLQPCGYTTTLPNGGNVKKTGLGVTMDQLAGGMLASLDRPVVNRTGLTGMFDIHVAYALDTAATAQPRAGGADSPGPELSAPDPTGPSVFTALQEQLGLKLASDKGPVEVLVIDHVERPSAN
jgi:uncharacterized protein (TIGR03435 family)